MEYLMQHRQETIIYSKKKTLKLIKAQTKLALHQGIQKSKKIENIPTSFTDILLQIMSDI